MAVVYLPFGYPVQSGESFDTIIYQGNVVRMYTLPIDPRSNTQLFNRKFLADTSVMRATLGPWMKGTAHASMGPKWATVMYQMVKSDQDSCWTAAENDWNDFTLSNQAAWRAAAPQQATYNDPGKIFYCYLQALLQMEQHFTGLTWDAPTFGESDSSDALVWWNRSGSSAYPGWLPKGIWDDSFAWIHYTGSWSVISDGAAVGGSYHKNTSVGASLHAYLYGKNVNVHYIGADPLSNYEIYLNGAIVDHADVGIGTLDFGFTFSSKGLQDVRLVATAVNLTFDYLEVF